MPELSGLAAERRANRPACSLLAAERLGYENRRKVAPADGHQIDRQYQRQAIREASGAARTRSCESLPRQSRPIEASQQVLGAFRVREWRDSHILAEHLRDAACLEPRGSLADERVVSSQQHRCIGSNLSAARSKLPL